MFFKQFEHYPVSWGLKTGSQARFYLQNPRSVFPSPNPAGKTRPHPRKILDASSKLLLHKPNRIYPNKKECMELSGALNEKGNAEPDRGTQRVCQSL